MPALGLRTEHEGAAEPVESATSPQVSAAKVASPDAAERRRALWSVAAVVVAGAALRLVVMNAYQPYSHNLDEIRNVEEAQAMLEDSTLRQAGYNYPSLLFDVELAVLGATSVLSGDEPIMDAQTFGSAVAERHGELRALRLATGVIPGVAMAGLAAAIAWVITRRWWTAALAGGLAALSPIDVLFGTYVTPDALSGVASLAAVLAATLVARRPTTARYVVAGALVGVAAGAKYNCVLTAVSLVVAHVVGNDHPLREWRKLAYAAFALVGLFLVTTPSALIAPIEVAVGFASVYRNYSVRGQFTGLGNGPGMQLSWLWYGFGIGLVAVPLCLLARRPVRRLALVPLSFCLVYPAVLAAPRTGYARNLLPVTGVVAAVAALGVYAAAELVRERRGAPNVLAPLAAAVLGVAVLALPAVHASSVLGDVDEDPWAETQEWMADNLPAGTVVAVESWGPVIDERRFEVVTTESLGNNHLAIYGLSGVDVVVSTSKRHEPHLRRPDDDPDATALYEAILHPGCRLFDARGGLDPVGGTDRPESIEIVVASVPDCVDIFASNADD